MKIRNINLVSFPATKTSQARLTLGVLAIAALTAGPGMAQEPEVPAFDGSLLDTCLENASLRLSQGDEQNAESCIGVAANACMESDAGSTTFGMTECIGQELGAWDAQLNTAYNKLIGIYEKAGTDADNGENERVKALKSMQLKWISYRDAACAFEAAQWGEGTAAAPASGQCALDLTARQALRLEVYVATEEEK